MIPEYGLDQLSLVGLALGGTLILWGYLFFLHLILSELRYRNAALGLTLILAIQGSLAFFLPQSSVSTALIIALTLVAFAGTAIPLLEIHRLRLDRESVEAEALEKRFVEEDLAITAKAQDFFLPQNHKPISGHYILHAEYQPAAVCGGDWWWKTVLEDGRLIVLVGDVTGHGPAPAVITVFLNSFLNRKVHQAQLDAVPELLKELDKCLMEICQGSYSSTIFAIEFNPRTQKVHYWSACAPTAYILHKDGSVHSLSGTNSMPLGFGDLRLNSGEENFLPGDRVVFFTDGLLDLDPATGKRYSNKRFREDLIALRLLSVTEMAQTLLEQLEMQRGVQKGRDDVTLIAVGAQSWT